MKITAQDLIRFGVIDHIITEPVGGAHRDPAAAIGATAVRRSPQAFDGLAGLDRDDHAADSGARNSSRSAAPSAKPSARIRPVSAAEFGR